jgi:hypothetical protein
MSNVVLFKRVTFTPDCLAPVWGFLFILLKKSQKKDFIA